MHVRVDQAGEHRVRGEVVRDRARAPAADSDDRALTRGGGGGGGGGGDQEREQERAAPHRAAGGRACLGWYTPSRPPPGSATWVRIPQPSSSTGAQRTWCLRMSA